MKSEKRKQLVAEAQQNPHSGNKKTLLQDFIMHCNQLQPAKHPTTSNFFKLFTLEKKRPTEIPKNITSVISVSNTQLQV